METTNGAVALFVDKASRQWIVSDREGTFRSLPSTDNPWGECQPFFPAEEMGLERVPGHYKYRLGAPV
jgi:hypothetical protein